MAESFGPLMEVDDQGAYNYIVVLREDQFEKIAETVMASGTRVSALLSVFMKLFRASHVSLDILSSGVPNLLVDGAVNLTEDEYKLMQGWIDDLELQ